MFGFPAATQCDLDEKVLIVPLSTQICGSVRFVFLAASSPPSLSRFRSKPTVYHKRHWVAPTAHEGIFTMSKRIASRTAILLEASSLFNSLRSVHCPPIASRTADYQMTGAGFESRLAPRVRGGTRLQRPDFTLGIPGWRIHIVVQSFDVNLDDLRRNSTPAFRLSLGDSWLENTHCSAIF
ncbi:hypothetical protein J6590_049463 [Homalodisca vitripennis]|nr:hypothetical protein J6590_049463 [Homalodisca vitripennis]